MKKITIDLYLQSGQRIWSNVTKSGKISQGQGFMGFDPYWWSFVSWGETGCWALSPSTFHISLIFLNFLRSSFSLIGFSWGNSHTMLFYNRYQVPLYFELFLKSRKVPQYSGQDCRFEFPCTIFVRKIFIVSSNSTCAANLHCLRYTPIIYNKIL